MDARSLTVGGGHPSFHGFTTAGPPRPSVGGVMGLDTPGVPHAHELGASVLQVRAGEPDQVTFPLAVPQKGDSIRIPAGP